MSGLISTGLGIANGIRSAISTGVGIITGISTEIGSLFGGDGPILLGDVTFDGHAVPPHMKWGGQQALAVHKLPGGQRVIDAMGRDDAVLEWSATFVADDAGDQAFAIDQMRIDGTPVPLIWGDHYYVVIVQMFEPSDQHQTIIPYKIACMVVQDMSQPAPGDPTTPIAAVSADASAATASMLGAAGSLSGMLSGVVSRLPDAAGALAGPLAAVSGKLSGALAQALPGLQGAISTVGLPPLALDLWGGAAGAAAGLSGALSTALPALSSALSGASGAIASALPSLQGAISGAGLPDMAGVSAGLSGAVSSMSGTLSSIAAAGPAGLVLGAASSGGAITAIGSVSDAVAGVQSAADTAMEGLTIAAAPLRGSIVASTAALTSAVGFAGISAQMAAAQGFIGRALGNAMAGPP